MTKRYLTAESVCAEHPDKLCDIIADSIVEAYLQKDKASRVVCEVMAIKGKIIVAGEFSCSEKVNIRDIVRSVLKGIGNNPLKFSITVYKRNQSVDIAECVNTSLKLRNIWCGYARKCVVGISYATGKSNPVTINVNTLGTGAVSDEKLRLHNVNYSDTAVYGHFNSSLFPWENVNKYSTFREVFEKYVD